MSVLLVAQNLQVYINMIQINEEHKEVYHGFHGQLGR